LTSRKPLRTHERATIEPVLPDLMAPDLAVVFCGTAPGTVSAAMKQYYAHPQNKFWRTLHALKLTPHQFDPAEYPELLRCRIGLTDIAKYSFGMDNQLPRASLGASAVSALRERIEKYRPTILAFTSLTGGRKFLGAKAQFGEQTERIGPTRIWVLPSPSPAAHWNWNEKIWRALGTEVRKVRKLRDLLPP
jgi:TDG/mug DNA glycosylase family protein